MRRLVLAAPLLAALWAPAASAAACCLSSSAFGIGRLASWEPFAVIVGSSASPVAGRWDEAAVWRPNTPGYAENELRAQLSVLGAVHERVQLAARVPLVMTAKTSSQVSEFNGGLGDSQVSVRYEPVFQGEVSWLPEIALTAGLTVPFGKTAMASQTALGSDVTSRGAFVPSASATFEWARDHWFAQAGGGLTVPLPMAGSEPGVTQRFGLGWQATAAGGYEVKRDLVFSLVGRYGYEGPLNVNGVTVAQSEAWDFGGSLNVAWKPEKHWTVQGGVDTGLFTRGLGENRQGRVTGSLGLRYAWF